MFLNRKIRRICILGNQHGLLHYLMLSSLDDINHTFFLWNYVGIPDSVVEKFGKRGAYIPSHNNQLQRVVKKVKGKSPKLDAVIGSCLSFFYYRIFYPLKFPFVLSSKYEFWGHDHVFNARCFLRNHPFYLVEDGTANYVPYSFSHFHPKQRFMKIKKLLFGENYGEYIQYMGSEKRCIKIYLAGLSDTGDVLNSPKVEVRSFDDMWNHSNSEKRLFINNVFGVSKKMLCECSKSKCILLTEAFSEEGVLSEKEKIDLYKNIINRIGRNDIIIKPHPREKTDYRTYFPNNVVLNITAPMQLLTLNGIRFDAAYSIYSTALFDFSYHIKVCCIGTEVHPKLYKESPDWTSDKIRARITNPNIEFIEL